MHRTPNEKTTIALISWLLTGLCAAGCAARAADLPDALPISQI
jgi:hypothetical protein